MKAVAIVGLCLVVWAATMAWSQWKHNQELKRISEHYNRIVLEYEESLEGMIGRIGGGN